MPPQTTSTDARQKLVEFFLDAYRQGAFPMAEPALTLRGQPRRRRRIDWFIPDPRAVIPIHVPPGAPGGFHISRSLARRLRSRRFRVTADRAFDPVIRACAEPTPGREDTWLDGQLMEAYTALHRAGHAHSVEAWLPCADGPDTLVGGVYGVAIGSLFSAESMFCRPELGGTDAGKVCLAHLVRHVHLRGFTVLDVQIANGHTAQFGVREIPASRYRALLAAGVDDHRSWGVLDGTWPSSTALPPDCGGPT